MSFEETSRDICRTILCNFEYIWRIYKVPEDWKKINVKKQDPGNYRPMNLTLILGKILEQIIREHI